MASLNHAHAFGVPKVACESKSAKMWKFGGRHHCRLATDGVQEYAFFALSSFHRFSHLLTISSSLNFGILNARTFQSNLSAGRIRPKKSHRYDPINHMEMQ